MCLEGSTEADRLAVRDQPGARGPGLPDTSAAAAGPEGRRSAVLAAGDPDWPLPGAGFQGRTPQLAPTEKSHQSTAKLPTHMML